MPPHASRLGRYEPVALALGDINPAYLYRAGEWPVSRETLLQEVWAIIRE